MGKNPNMIAGVVGALLLVILFLPLSLRGTGNPGFWSLFWALVLCLVAALYYAITHRPQQP
jgi:hypothetical protein